MSRAGSMNVNRLTVAIPAAMSSFTSFSLRDQGKARSLTPSPTRSLLQSASSCYSDASMSSDGSFQCAGSQDYLLGNQESPAHTKSSMTDAQANDIRCMHGMSLCDLHTQQRAQSIDITSIYTTGDGGMDIDWVQAGKPAYQEGESSDDEDEPSYYDSIFDEICAMDPLFDSFDSPQEPSPAPLQLNKALPAPPQLEKPLPALPETLIDPYEFDARELNVTDDDLPFALSCLQNSGVSFLTDYPVVHSPRQHLWEVINNLKYADFRYEHTSRSLPVGVTFDYNTHVKVRTKEVCFTPFSYTNAEQPRTTMFREFEGEPMSPRTKAPIVV